MPSGSSVQLGIATFPYEEIARRSDVARPAGGYRRLMPVEPSPTAWTFPGPERLDESDDLVAAGADLAPGTILAAYRRGMFPMPSGSPGDPMYWWSPVRRGVLPVRGVHVSRSLRRSARDYEICVHTAFEEVVDA